MPFRHPFPVEPGALPGRVGHHTGMSAPGKVALLPGDFGSLNRGLPPAEPGTLFALGSAGGIRVAPDARFEIVFGRNAPDVHVCVGADDPHVSRRHGTISRSHRHWVLTNLGRLPIRFPNSRLVLSGDRVELPPAYTPLFIVGPKREHLLEVRVAAGPVVSAATVDPHGDETPDPQAWPLSPVERLVLTCLSQRYLRQEPAPQPLTWAQVAHDLGHLQPAQQWTGKRAAHIVTNVRKRLSATVPGLREEEIPPPVGNALNQNLILELLVTTTITKADLGLLDGQPYDPSRQSPESPVRWQH